MIKIVRNKNRGGSVDASVYSYEATAEIRRLHESLNVYKVTPLIELKTKNIGAVYVKDESKRFGLKAFKGLGGIWAMHKIIAESGEKPGNMTFITTTDGNHGKGVSWAAGIFGSKAQVYMPRGTVEVRAQAIRDAGSAQVTITDLTYDECVKFTAELATKNHWHLIQDTSWAGYEEIPFQIMRGYTTLAYEAIKQMPKLPTHIFLQAGVGSMAASIAAVFSEPKNKPRITLIEPEAAGCFYETLKIGDGKIHSATGNGQTMMAGLNCGTPCELAWDILKNCAADTAIISDDVAAAAMRELAAQGIISGESGCAGFALAFAADKSSELRRELELDSDSIIFVINTEGATDSDNYARITADI